VGEKYEGVEKLLRGYPWYTIYVVIGVGAVLLYVVSLCTWCCCCKGPRSEPTKSAKGPRCKINLKKGGWSIKCDK